MVLSVALLIRLRTALNSIVQSPYTPVLSPGGSIDALTSPALTQQRYRISDPLYASIPESIGTTKQGITHLRLAINDCCIMGLLHYGMYLLI